LEQSLSIMATVFRIKCFLQLHLNAWMIHKSKCCSWMVQLAERNNTLMLVRNVVWAAHWSMKSKTSQFLAPFSI
jgi:hypothetical protein